MYESISLYTAVGWFALLAGCIALNELCRCSKWFSLLLFLVLPAILAFTLWPQTAGPGTTMGVWFYHVKVWSVLAACLGFMAIRFVPGLARNKWALLFPAFILAINIAEAVFRDFEVYNLRATGQVIDGMRVLSGPWNIMNGIAGILNILTISGWAGIFISRNKAKDMIWPDMLWFWILAYDLWNFAYGYNSVGDHSFYSGLCLLAACTIPALWWSKGAWLQHRAHTLAFWMMLCMTGSWFLDDSLFAVKASLNPTALFVVSFLALVVNIAVFVYHFAKVIKYKRNVAVAVHPDLAEYRDLVAEHSEAGHPGSPVESSPRWAVEASATSHR